MPLTIPDAWLSAMYGSVKPVWIVEFLCGPFAWGFVEDYNAGAGDSITFTVRNLAGSTILTVTFVEGVEFSRGASNLACATNIVAALNALLGNLRGAVIGTGGTFVLYSNVPQTTMAAASIRVTSTDEAAWFSNISPVDRPQKFISDPSIFKTSAGVTTSSLPASLAKVSTIASTIDPLTRKTTIEGLTLTFVDDRLIEELVIRVPLKGQDVNLYLGDPRMPTTDFFQVGRWTVDKVSRTYGEYVVECSSIESQLNDVEVTPYMKCVHPFAAARYLVDEAGAAPYRDVDSFDYSTAPYATIHHWAVSNHDDYLIARNGGPNNIQPELIDKKKAKDVIDALLRICNASIYTDETGEIVLKWYDENAAVSDNWTANDVADVRLEDVYYGLKTEFRGIGGQIEGAGDQRQQYIALRDDITRAMLGSGADAKTLIESVQSDWIGSRGYLNAPILAGGTNLEIIFPCDAGLSGCRTSSDAFTQTAADAPSATRIAYFLLMDNFGNREIVSVTSAPSFAGATTNYNSNRIVTIPAVLATPGLATFTIASRGLFGTSDRLWGTGGGGYSPNFRVDVVDVTIFVHTLGAQLRRFANGAPVFSMRTRMDKFRLQKGDFLQFAHPLVSFWENRGIVTSGVYEIIHKEVDLSGDSPGIKWRICLARDIVARAPITVYPIIPSNPLFQPGDDPITDNAGVIVTDNVGNIAYR